MEPHRPDAPARGGSTLCASATAASSISYAVTAAVASAATLACSVTAWSGARADPFSPPSPPSSSSIPDERLASSVAVSALWSASTTTRKGEAGTCAMRRGVCRSGSDFWLNTAPRLSTVRMWSCEPATATMPSGHGSLAKGAAQDSGS